MPTAVDCGHHYCPECASLLVSAGLLCACKRAVTFAKPNVALGEYLVGGVGGSVAADDAASSSVVECDTCGAKATQQCSVCEEKVLCDDCGAKHSKKHPMEDLTSSRKRRKTAAAAASSSSPVCGKHGGLPLDHFCHDHACFVCAECALYDHPVATHKLAKLTNITADESSLLVGGLAAQLASGVAPAQAAVGTVAAARGAMLSHVSAQRASAVARFAVVRAEIDALETALLNKVDALLEEREKELSSQLRECEMSVSTP